MCSGRKWTACGANRTTVSLLKWHQGGHKNENTLTCWSVGLTGLLRVKRAQIKLMNWPKGPVHIRHHHITLINILPGKPLRAFIFIRSKLSNSRGGFFFLNYCPFGCSEGSQLSSSLPLKMHYASPEGSLNQRD